MIIDITLIIAPAWSKEELESVSLPEEWYKSVMGFNVPHGQERMLYMFVAGDGAAVADSLEDAEIITTITDLLRNFTSRDIPPPDRLFRHRWTTDPFTECGYSYPTIRQRPPLQRSEIMTDLYRHTTHHHPNFSSIFS